MADVLERVTERGAVEVDDDDAVVADEHLVVMEAPVNRGSATVDVAQRPADQVGEMLCLGRELREHLPRERAAAVSSSACTVMPRSEM